MHMVCVCIFQSINTENLCIKKISNQSIKFANTDSFLLFLLFEHLSLSLSLSLPLPPGAECNWGHTGRSLPGSLCHPVDREPGVWGHREWGLPALSSGQGYGEEDSSPVGSEGGPGGQGVHVQADHGQRYNHRHCSQVSRGKKEGVWGKGYMQEGVVRGRNRGWGY